MPIITVKSIVAQPSFSGRNPGLTSQASFSRKRMLSPRFKQQRAHIDTLNHALGGLNRRMLAPVLDRKHTTMMGGAARGTLSGKGGARQEAILVPDELYLQRRRRQPTRTTRSVSCGIRPFPDKNKSTLCEKLIKVELHREDPALQALENEVKSPRKRPMAIATKLHAKGASTREVGVGNFFKQTDNLGNLIPYIGEEVCIRRRRAVSNAPEDTFDLLSLERETCPDRFVCDSRRKASAHRPATALTPAPERALDLNMHSHRRHYARSASAQMCRSSEGTSPSATSEFLLPDGTPVPPGKRCSFGKDIYRVEPPIRTIQISRTQRLYGTNPNVVGSDAFGFRDAGVGASRNSTSRVSVHSRRHVIPIGRIANESHVASLIYSGDEYNISPCPTPRTPLGGGMAPRSPRPPLSGTVTPRSNDAHQQPMISPRFLHRSPSRPLSGPDSIFV